MRKRRLNEMVSSLPVPKASSIGARDCQASVTAEVIAKVYYAALREATGSRLLRRLCDQILRDEVAHVHFQTERLAVLRAGRSSWRVRFSSSLHRFLMFGTIFVVWHKHGRAMKHGGYSFGRFWRDTWKETHAALRRAEPAAVCSARFSTLRKRGPPSRLP